MNTKLFKLITAGALAVLLSSCGDSVVDNYDNSPVRSKATINVRVIDASGGAGAPLAASVTLNTTKETKTTDATGSVSFGNIPAGGHSVIIEKAGYATATYTATITSSNQSNISIVNDVTVPVTLYPKTASLSGTVFEENDDGTLKPLDSATVRVELDNTSIVTRIFTKVTAADGSFAFDSLPAVGQAYSLVVSDKNKKYKVITGPTRELKAELPAYAGTIRFNSSQLNTLFELVDYKYNIKSTDNITFTFSNSIDFSRFTIDNVSISPSGSISNGGKITRIIPATAADPTQLIIGLTGATADKIPQWPNKFQICFDNLKATDGKSTGGNYCTRDIYTTDNAVKFRLETYKDRIDSTEAVVLTFSTDVNTTEFKSSWIEIDDKPVIFAEVVPAGKTITLTPVGGKWQKDFKVTLKSDLKAANGEELKADESKNITLKTKPVVGPVKAPVLDSIAWGTDTLDYNAPSAILTWEKVLYADEYLIYGKASAGTKPTEYVFLTSVPNENNIEKNTFMLKKIVSFDKDLLGLYYDDVGYINALQNNNTLEIIIQAWNKDSQTKLSEATALVLKDTKKPVVKNAYKTGDGYIVAPTTNAKTDLTTWLSTWFYTLTATSETAVNVVCVEFSEPMDVTVPLAGNFVAAGTETAVATVSQKLAVKPEWGNKALLDAAYGVNVINKKDYDKYLCLTLSTVTTDVTFAVPASLDVRYRINDNLLKDKTPTNFLEMTSGTTVEKSLQIKLTY